MIAASFIEIYIDRDRSALTTVNGGMDYAVLNTAQRSCVIGNNTAKDTHRSGYNGILSISMPQRMCCGMRVGNSSITAIATPRSTQGTGS